MSADDKNRKVEPGQMWKERVSACVATITKVFKNSYGDRYCSAKMTNDIYNKYFEQFGSLTTPGDYPTWADNWDYQGIDEIICLHDCCLPK
jgi:hypothetical protein